MKLIPALEGNVDTVEAVNGNCDKFPVHDIFGVTSFLGGKHSSFDGKCLLFKGKHQVKPPFFVISAKSLGESSSLWRGRLPPPPVNKTLIIVQHFSFLFQFVLTNFPIIPNLKALSTSI